jgi:hypothetical protein
MTSLLTLQISSMMTSLMFGTLTFFIISPAISICDEDKGQHESSEINSATQHPQYDAHNEAPEYDPWSFYRKLRAPSGFFGVRGKKDFDPENYWEIDVSVHATHYFPETIFIIIRMSCYHCNLKEHRRKHSLA